ncbi:MAG: energy-coupling factor transporter transmembrane protein EcfT [Eubacterium sp.]|nr:energy-coupling factor transporter transmembrane protein EcfT [Eubacterium sp.]
MLQNITIGQYFPGKSLIHKIDPRMKIVLILLLMASVFVCTSYPAIVLSLAMTVAVVILSRINLKVILKGMKPILFIVLITALLNLFYSAGEPLWQFWVFKISLEGIHSAVFMALRVVLLVVIGLMLTYTTTPTALTDAIEALLKPLHVLFKLDIHSLAMTMTIALRFIPTLIEEVDKIMSAQKSRGADMESGNLIKRVKAIVPVLIPLFVSAFRRANELAYAMECRCYRGGEGRTKMKVMHLAARDYLSLAAVLVYITALILIRIFVPSVL